MLSLSGGLAPSWRDMEPVMSFTGKLSFLTVCSGRGTVSEVVDSYERCLAMYWEVA